MKDKSTVLGVQHLIGIPDYESFFQEIEGKKGNIVGLTAAQEFRISAKPTLSGSAGIPSYDLQLNK